MRALIAAPFLLLLVLFALSNGQSVQFGLWPTDLFAGGAAFDSHAGGDGGGVPARRDGAMDGHLGGAAAGAAGGTRPAPAGGAGARAEGAARTDNAAATFMTRPFRNPARPA